MRSKRSGVAAYQYEEERCAFALLYCVEMVGIKARSLCIVSASASRRPLVPRNIGWAL